MIVLFGIYILLGAVMTGVLLAIIRKNKIVLIKDDKFLLFSLCCALTLAYPYFAIKAVYTLFKEKAKKDVIEAEVL